MNTETTEVQEADLHRKAHAEKGPLDTTQTTRSPLIDRPIVRIALGMSLPLLLLLFWQYKATGEGNALAFLATPASV